MAHERLTPASWQAAATAAARAIPILLAKGFIGEAAALSRRLATFKERALTSDQYSR